MVSRPTMPDLATVYEDPEPVDPSERCPYVTRYRHLREDTRYVNMKELNKCNKG